MRKLFIKLLVVSLFGFSVFGQANVKSFEFKKGEVLDILLLSTHVNAAPLFEKYKKTVFPVGFEYTFQPQPGFKIEKLVLGNYKPTSLVIGKWKSKLNREGFLNNIVNRVPDFHEQRKALFSYFGLTYYEMQKDLSFSVDTDKYIVAAAFWGKDKKSFENFYNKWENKMKKKGAKLIVKFENGKSPTGYYYNADVFCIIEWESKKAFEAFTQKHPLSSYEALKNVHQFVIK